MLGARPAIVLHVDRALGSVAGARGGFQRLAHYGESANVFGQERAAVHLAICAEDFQMEIIGDVLGHLNV